MELIELACDGQRHPLMTHMHTGGSLYIRVLVHRFDPIQDFMLVNCLCTRAIRATH